MNKKKKQKKKMKTHSKQKEQDGLSFIDPYLSEDEGLTSSEVVIKNEYGELGVLVYDLLDGNVSLTDIHQITGVSEWRLAEIAKFCKRRKIVWNSYGSANLVHKNSTKAFIFIRSAGRFKKKVEKEFRFSKNELKILSLIDGKHLYDCGIAALKTHLTSLQVREVIAFCRQLTLCEFLQIIRSKDENEISKEVLRLIDLAIDDPSSYYFRRYGFYKQKDFWEVLNKLNKTIKDDPSNYKAIYNRGLCHFLSQNLYRSKKDFLRAVKVKSGFTNGMLCAGFSEELIGDRNSALFYYHNYLSIVDDSKIRAIVLEHLSETKQILQKNECAALCSLIIDRKVESKNILVASAISYFDKDLFGDAIREITKYMQEDQNCAAAFNIRGTAVICSLLLLENEIESCAFRIREGAIKDFDVAIKLDPECIEALFNRGLVRFNVYPYATAFSHDVTSFSAAFSDFFRVIKLKSLPRAFYFRGRIYQYWSQLNEASSDYEKALELDPGLESAKIELDYVRGKNSHDQFPLQKNTIDRSANEETISASNLISKSDINFSHVGGMENLKFCLRTEIERFLDEKKIGLAKKFGIDESGSILLYGPPGVGKSHIIEALAGEVGCRFIRVRISDVLSKWHGTTEKNISAIFDDARQNQPTLIFFDEVEALGGSREDMQEHWARTLINQFLLEMDNVWKNKEKILVMGATNAPWHVDVALTRSGRFGKTLFVPPPDVISRKDIFDIYTSKIKLKDKINCKKLAELSEGFSGANIAHVCREVAMRKFNLCIKEDKELKVCLDDFEAVITEIKGKKLDVERWLDTIKRSKLDVESYPDLVPLESKRKIGSGRMFR